MENANVTKFQLQELFPEASIFGVSFSLHVRGKGSGSAQLPSLNGLSSIWRRCCVCAAQKKQKHVQFCQMKWKSWFLLLLAAVLLLSLLQPYRKTGFALRGDKSDVLCMFLCSSAIPAENTSTRLTYVLLYIFLYLPFEIVPRVSKK